MHRTLPIFVTFWSQLRTAQLRTMNKSVVYMDGTLANSFDEAVWLAVYCAADALLKNSH